MDYADGFIESNTADIDPQGSSIAGSSRAGPGGRFNVAIAKVRAYPDPVPAHGLDYKPLRLVIPVFDRHRFVIFVSA